MTERTPPAGSAEPASDQSFPSAPAAAGSAAPAARPPSRRSFLLAGAAAGLGTRWLAGGSAALAPVLLARPARADAIGPQTALERVRAAHKVRKDAAKWQSLLPLPDHPDSGDDALYLADRRGSFTKGLPHDDHGVVDPAAYGKLLTALASGKHADFEALTMGSFSRMVCPQAAYHYLLEGPDSHHTGTPAAPAFASARTAAEMVEVFWQAHTRDVPFSRYETDPTIAQACAELSALSDYGGPHIGGTVVPQLVFRSSNFVDVVGPYLSQFLWLTVPFGGAMDKEARYKAPVLGDDYVTTYAKWLSVLRGVPQAQENVYQPQPRFLCTGRDLANYVHRDFKYQSFLDAALYLCDLGPSALAPTNPYKFSSTQAGFVAWGQPFFVDLLARACAGAMKACWYHKWLVHRRVRPEKLAGLLHDHLLGGATYDLHPELLNSQAVAEAWSRQGTYLLAQAYPEGCPLHPAYPSGHAAAVGASATVLKALFDENLVLPAPVVANDDGTALLPYAGPDLTVRSELDKLAWNVGMGRCAAGIHYRSDIEAGLRVGEAFAAGMLHDYLDTLNEPFSGFQFTSFDGVPVTVA